MAKSAKGFIVILPQTIIEIPQDSNLSWLTLFYALPKELVEKRKEYLYLPRNITQLLNDEDSVKLIESDAFLELVWDCYAWAAWQFFQVPFKNGTYHDIPGDWQHYSGDFPLWRLSYEIIRHFRKKFETEMEFSFQKLFLMGSEAQLPWFSYKQFSNLIGNLTDMIVAEQNWQPTIDTVWKERQPDDYNRGQNTNKRDFMRSWYHSRTAKQVSLEDIYDTGVKLDSKMLYDISDPRASFESDLVTTTDMDRFKTTLSEQDKQILQMRYHEYSLKEIADAVGFKTPSAVYKHIESLAGRYDDFIGHEYSQFLKKHPE